DQSFQGPLAAYCQELARYGMKQHVLFYVFTLKDWRRDSVIGYMWHHNQWDRLELPAPDVLHNRIGQRKLENLQATRSFFSNLEARGIPYFNAKFLDKWEVHAILSKHPELEPYLPETVLYERKESLKKMFAQHQSLFLKPAAGSQGKQIFRIQRRENVVTMDHTTSNNEGTREFGSFDDLYFTLKERLQRQPYIIQQGLCLMDYHSRPLDFRLLCNKGSNGTWKLTSGIARVSGEEQFVSNLARGGSTYSVYDVLQETFYEKHAKQIRRLLKELALEIAALVSFHTNDGYGDLGIDLALDQQGKPWILEVNTKPSKDLDPERGASKIRPSAKAVIDYGEYLARFTIT
ncbi:MAG TPA: YheC/YheD family protein, partial [Bacillales bacterium]|nr:YheC/YheD family protein [Bacillales bacterium]